MSGTSDLRALPSIQFVRQNGEADCGPACLCMALRYHGVDVTLEALSRELPLQSAGVTATALLKTAEFYGLNGVGISLAAQLVPFLPRASILHWESSHFVIYESFDGSEVRLLDPARGPRAVAVEEVETGFTGTALVFGPLPIEIRQYL